MSKFKCSSDSELCPNSINSLSNKLSVVQPLIICANSISRYILCFFLIWDSRLWAEMSTYSRSRGLIYSTATLLCYYDYCHPEFLPQPHFLCWQIRKRGKGGWISVGISFTGFLSCSACEQVVTIFITYSITKYWETLQWKHLHSKLL